MIQAKLKRGAQEEIKAQLRAQLGHRWKVGERMPAIKELARVLDAGQGNTNRAVRDLVAEGLLVSRRRRGTFVCGHPRATPLQASRHPTPPLMNRRIQILRNSDEPFLGPMLRVLEQVFGDAGATCQSAKYNMLAPSAALADHATADAVILINPFVTMPIQPLDNQLVVVINTAMQAPAGADGRYDAVLADSEQGGLLAGQHMRKINSRSICFLGVGSFDTPSIYDPTSAARLHGFEQGFGPIAPSCRLVATTYKGEQGARLVATYMALPDRPQGVFCASDDLAVGFVLGGLAHGLEPIRDYQLIGFDGQYRGRGVAGGPLTTIDVPMERMGRLAADMLIQRFAEPQQPPRRLFVGCTLFQGRTTTTLSSSSSTALDPISPITHMDPTSNLSRSDDTTAAT